MRDLLEKLDRISTPVNEAASVSINMNAETCDDVGELMKLMTNAGLKPSIVQTAKMDDPENPGKDDVVGCRVIKVMQHISKQLAKKSL